jgi:hypothetical protein
MNDMSSEILYLLDPGQGLCMLEGNISRRDMASCERRLGQRDWIVWSCRSVVLTEQ